MPRATSTVATWAPQARNSRPMNTMPGMVLKTDKTGRTTPDSLGRRDSRMPSTRPSAKPMATDTRVNNRCSPDGHGKFIHPNASHPQSCSAMAEVMLVLVMMPATFSSSSRTTR